MNPSRQVGIAIMGVCLMLLLWACISPVGANPFIVHLPFGDWAQSLVDWLTTNARAVFQVIKSPIKFVLDVFMGGLRAAPPTIVIVTVFLIAWQASGLRLACFCAAALGFLGFIGVWEDTMLTLALTLSSLLFCLVAGIPLGIATAKSLRVAAVVRPILDIMQTCPAFVYLIPIVMLVGIGNVPGVAVTVIFALPPLIRLTELGIRQVQPDVIEAAKSFGATPSNILFDVELPLAWRTIMAGINQTLMMALSMVVVASMIAVEGLGLLVLRGIGRLDMGLAAVGGVGIVLLAMVLDRLTQAISSRPALVASSSASSTKPVELIRSLFTFSWRTRSDGKLQ